MSFDSKECPYIYHIASVVQHMELVDKSFYQLAVLANEEVLLD